jgi:hypothetical protein
MILRAPLHVLILVGLLVAFGSQAAQSYPDLRPSSPVEASDAQAAAPGPIATSGAPGRQAIAATAALTNTDALTNTIYIPSMVQVAPPPIDLSIQGLEITQAVQTPSNSVPLIAGRPTIVRVYAKYAGTIVPGNVSVSLAGSRNGVALAPVKLGPQAISATPSRANYSSSFNLPLPTSWLSGTVAITATIDSGAAVEESDETNNNATATLKFNSVPALDIVIVPINYTHTGPINPGVYPPPAADTISDFIKRTYPLSTVHVTFRSPMNFTGDLSYIDSGGQAPYWGNNTGTGLLNRVTALKGLDLDLEGGINSPKVYYGLVSTGSTPSNTWVPLSSSKGFVLGIGWVGTRASAGLDIPASFGLSADITSDTAAHEIGHNLGRQHAPCKTTSGLDPEFPNSTASIEQFGLDVSKGKVLNPSTTKDVMSYCEPQWVSDYTYKGLYNALIAKQFDAISPAPRASLLVRGGIGSDGTGSLAPIYNITGVPNAAPSSSDYRVEFLDAAGNVVESQPVAVSEMEQPHVVALSQGRLVEQANPLAVRGMDKRAPQMAINAIVAAPAKPFSSVRLVHAGTVVATRALRPAGPTIAAAAARAERQADSTLLRWNAASGPALVRYTADGGATWATLGVDVLGGELQIDTDTLASGGYFEIIPADSAAPVVRVTAP